MSAYRVTLARLKAFEVELEEGTREAVEWFILSDYPDATFEWGASGRVMAWETTEARQQGELPIACVEPVAP